MKIAANTTASIAKLDNCKTASTTSASARMESAKLDTIARPETQLVGNFRNLIKDFNPGGLLCW